MNVPLIFLTALLTMLVCVVVIFIVRAKYRRVWNRVMDAYTDERTVTGLMSLAVTMVALIAAVWILFR